MVITHESNYGREYHVRVVLTTNDIEGIAARMCTSCENVDGKVLALFIRGALVEVLRRGLSANLQSL